MAKINKPAANRKGAPPPPEETRRNLSRNADTDLTALNFKVTAEFKREFKTYATQMDISMVQLLTECFQAYKNSR